MQDQDIEEAVDIEAIMQEIRQKILTDKAGREGDEMPHIPVTGKRLPAEFYEHLYYAGMAYDQIAPKMHVTKVNVPLVGRFIERVRTKLHELVLYYLNQSAAQQIKVNHHLLQALSSLSKELEQNEQGQSHD